jgi:hypothetical protein
MRTEKEPETAGPDPIMRILFRISIALIIVFEVVAGVARSFIADSANRTRIRMMYDLGGFEAVVRTCATPIERLGIYSGCRLEKTPQGGMIIVFVTSFSRRAVQTMPENSFIMREIVQINPELPPKGNANTAFPFFF